VTRTQAAHSHGTARGANLAVVASNPITVGERGSFLLELLHFAGWRIAIRSGIPTTIRATRDDVALEVIETTLPRAAGVVFARAMRSNRSGRAGNES